MANSVNSINTSLYKNLSYNFVADFAPVVRVMRSPLFLLVHPSVPAKTVPEFIAYAKANPGKISMGSGGSGSTGHMAGELFKMQPACRWCTCRIAASRLAMTDLLGRPGAGGVRDQRVVDHIVKAGTVRALAVTSSRRASMACRTFRRLAEFLPGLRGGRLERPVRAEGTRRTGSSPAQHGRSTPRLPIQRSGSASPTWAASRPAARLPRFGKLTSPMKSADGEGRGVRPHSGELNVGRECSVVAHPQICLNTVGIAGAQSDAPEARPLPAGRGGGPSDTPPSADVTSAHHEPQFEVAKRVEDRRHPIVDLGRA